MRCVGWVVGNPDVNIAGDAWITVIADGIAPDEEKVDAVSVEQSQEPFEVERKLDGHN
jgi:hypothetical protein